MLILLLFCFTVCACTYRPNSKLLIYNVEHSIDTNPEAALASLDSILNPDLSLGHADYMKYALLHVEAAYLSFKDMKNDTAVFEACRYYEEKHDLPQLTKATLYSACVLEAQGQTDAAVDTYNKAFALASQNTDSTMMAKARFYLGNLNYNTGCYDEAAKNFMEADMYYAYDLSKKALIYRTLGQTFLLRKENDSALHYLEKGLDLTRKTKDVANESDILNTMSIVYREKGNYTQSLELLRQSVSVGIADNDSIRLYLNYANLFLGMGEMDSAGFYAAKLKKVVKNVADGPEQAAIYVFLSRFESAFGSIDSAFVFEQQHVQALDKEYRRRLQQSVYEAQRKYDFEAQQNHYYQQIAQRRKTIIVLAFALLSLSVLLSVLLLVNLRRNKEMLQTKEKLLSFEKRTFELQNELDRQKKQQSNLSDQTKLLQRTMDLLTNANVYKKESLKNRFKILCNMEIHIQNKGDKELLDVLRSSMYGKSDFWTAALKVVDELYPDVAKNIRKNCPELTENEFKTAVFILMNVPRKTEAVLLNNSVDMVDKNRTKVRKMLIEHKFLEEKSSEKVPESSE